MLYNEKDGKQILSNCCNAEVIPRGQNIEDPIINFCMECDSILNHDGIKEDKTKLGARKLIRDSDRHGIQGFN